jgi:hypothetical protein
MPKRIGNFIIHSADDEMPDCMCCDRVDDDFDCCNKCGAEYGWGGYRRTEIIKKIEGDINGY